MSSYKAFEKQSMVFNAGLIKKKKGKKKRLESCCEKNSRNVGECFDQSWSLRFLLLSPLLYVVSFVKIFNMNRGYVSKSYKETKDTNDRQHTERGQI